MPVGVGLTHHVELDPVEKGFVVDRSGVCRPGPEGLAIGLAGPSHVRIGDGAERHQVDAVDLDLRPANPMAPADPRPWTLPEPEGHGDVPGCDVIVQLLAELHRRDVRTARSTPGPPGGGDWSR